MFTESEHVVEQVDDYLHGNLDHAQTQYLRQHCGQCRICSVALEEARARFQAMTSVPPAEPSEKLFQGAMQRVRDDRDVVGVTRKWIRRGAPIAIAAAILLIGGLNLYFYRYQPSPFDLRIMTQRQWWPGTLASLRVRVTDQHRGRPIWGVPLELTLEKRDRSQTTTLVKYTSRSDGDSPEFRVPDWPDGDYVLKVVARVDGDVEIMSRPIQLRRSFQVMLSTDKPVYQPGQTIHLRSLALRRPDLKPETGQAVDFRIRDPRGNTIFREQTSTSRFGISSASCPLADVVTAGRYQIQCDVGGTTSSVAVEVRPYVLPKFRVGLNADQNFYQPGQPVRISLAGEYFFGEPVADGEVKWEVVTDDALELLVTSSEGRTNADGNCQFEFGLPERWPGAVGRTGSADGAFRVMARLIDRAGQEYTTSLRRVVTRNPLRVQVIPEGGKLVQGVPNRLFVFTSYADGRPASTRLMIVGHENEITTSALGVGALEITPDRPVKDLTLRAVDNQGISTNLQINLDSVRTTSDFLVRLDKPVYRGGETVRLQAFGTGSEPVFIDLLKDGQTMLTRSVAIQDGQGELEIDLPAELFGTMQLVSYRFDPDGLPIRRSRTLFVRQANEVRLSVTASQASYEPGDTARLEFQLTNAAGEPVPGAISLSVVDEAVFSVLGRRAGLDETFFLMEQELLEPIMAVYAWSPASLEEVLPEERQLFEEALFARTAQASLSRRALAGAYGVIATSFPSKQRQALRYRKQGLQRVVLAWVGLMLGGFLIAWIYALLSSPRVTLIVTGIVGAPALVLAVLFMFYTTLATRLADTAMDSLAMSGAVENEAFSTDSAGAEKGSERGSLRMRQWFPETLLWQPELVSDDQGRATLEFPLADSITTWRLTASAVTARGDLGARQLPIKVFQPFFVDVDLPVAFVRNDEVTVPVIVYNYLDEPQTVDLQVTDADWWEYARDVADHSAPSTWTVELQPGEVKSIGIPIRVLHAGRHTWEVTARANQHADAIRRAVRVEPDGYRQVFANAGVVHDQANVSWSVPDNSIPGSIEAVVRIHPSLMSQLVEGLDAIFRRPYGCFEQTTSTTYPNVLALNYLRDRRRDLPEVTLRARQFIHLGYQRLLTFECSGGGFDWFGRSPANVPLTAYGLMEFQDMAQVYDVDPSLIQRTRRFLMDRRNADGSWTPVAHTFRSALNRNANLRQLTTTAYVAWSVFQQDLNDARPTVDYLHEMTPNDLEDPYVLSLIALALLQVDDQDPIAHRLVARVVDLCQSDGQGRSWWNQVDENGSMFYGSGQAGNVECTALAALCLMKAQAANDVTRQSLRWLIEQKDPEGTWHSTQATILALKALLTGDQAAGEISEVVHCELQLDGRPLRTLEIPENQGEVMQLIDLSDLIMAGDHQLTMLKTSGPDLVFETSLRYHVPEIAEVTPQLDIRLTFDRETMRIGQQVQATAVIRNGTNLEAPMIMIDLPIPAGFRVVSADLESWKSDGLIDKYELTARQVIVYVRRLPAQSRLELSYRIEAGMAARVQTGVARTYEYYNPQRNASAAGTTLEVTP